jgi:uncharacterized lipoprotein YbaY
MTRYLLAAVVFALIPCPGRGDKTELVRVTGTVILPKGEKLPPKAKVSVKVMLYRPDGGVTVYSAVGTQEFTPTDPNKPITFAVPFAKSHLEKYEPGQFLLRATISAPDGRLSKTIYDTDDRDEIMPVDSNHKPKTNVKLFVSKVQQR